MLIDRFLKKRAIDSDKVIRRANAAQRLLDDELVAEAFEHIELEYMNGIISSGAKQAEEREALYLSIKALHKMRGYLESCVDDGKIESARIERMK